MWEPSAHTHTVELTLMRTSWAEMMIFYHTPVFVCCFLNVTPKCLARRAFQSQSFFTKRLQDQCFRRCVGTLCTHTHRVQLTLMRKSWAEMMIFYHTPGFVCCFLKVTPKRLARRAFQSKSFCYKTPPRSVFSTMRGKHIHTHTPSSSKRECENDGQK